MADQEFLAGINTLRLDLHRCKYREALDAVKMKIEECYRYGVTTLEVVHGTPKQFVGTLAEASLEAAGASSRVIHHHLPDISEYQTRVLRNPALTIHLHPNPTPQPQASQMVFMPFNAFHEPHDGHGDRFAKEYYPFREWIPFEQLATYLGGQLPDENVYLHSKRQRNYTVDERRDW